MNMSFLKKRIYKIIFFLFFIYTLIPSDLYALENIETEEFDEPVTMQLYWRSLNPSKEGLSNEIAQLYIGLATLKDYGWKVPIDTAQLDENTKSVQALSRKNKLFFGPNYPEELNNFLCNLNPKTCNRKCNKQGDDQNKWCHGKTANINIPKLDLEPIIVFATYDKKEGDNIKSIVVKDREGCESFTKLCSSLIVKLNNGNNSVLETSHNGNIVVPTRIYETVIDIEVPHGLAIKTWPKGEKQEGNYIYDLSQQGIDNLFFAFGNGIKNIAPLELSPLLKPQSGGCEDQAALPIVDNDTLLKQINHPFVYGVKVPKLSTFIALYDGWLDNQHCAINVERWFPQIGDPLSAPINLDNCSHETITVNNIDSAHATHLAGIISIVKGALSNENINARLHVIQLSPGKFVVQPTSVLDAAKRMTDTIGNENYKVANLSWGYPKVTPNFRLSSGLDSIEDVIKNRFYTLFVVAAGNQGNTISVTSACPYLPACHEYPNMITVVASITESGMQKVLDCSNRGTEFDIIAPGGRLLSAVPNSEHDAMATMTGTSQATAVVSGVASMLFGACRTASTENIRKRLILTSDFYHTLGDSAYGGMINAFKALNVKDEQFTYIDVNREKQTIYGRNENLTGIENEEVRISLTNAYEDGEYKIVSLRLKTIMRITRVIDEDSENTQYVIFFKGLTREESDSFSAFKNIIDNDLFDQSGMNENQKVNMINEYHLLSIKSQGLRKINTQGIELKDSFKFKGHKLNENSYATVSIPTDQSLRIIDFVRDFTEVQCE